MQPQIVFLKTALPSIPGIDHHREQALLELLLAKQEQRASLIDVRLLIDYNSDLPPIAA